MTVLDLFRRLTLLDPRNGVKVVVPLDLFWKCANHVHLEWRAGRTVEPMTNDKMPTPNCMIAGHWIVGSDAP